MSSPVLLSPLALQDLLIPLLSSLPTAAISPSPPTVLLPSLSPILRQRVQILSAASSDPWLPLLCYDASKVSKLQELAQSDKLEPHPISNEVEIDWEHDVEVQYKRVDEETLNAIVGLREQELAVQCIWCTGDQEGGGDGWRIGEVKLLEDNKADGATGSIREAEEAFKAESTKKDGYLIINTSMRGAEVEEDDDDDYWAQYDNTPARTPALDQQAPPTGTPGACGDEDSYYAQYASVQPAMDNHDPDEEVPENIESSLGSHFPETGYEPDAVAELAHPRPGSSSSGEDTVARLEREAAREVESREETAVKQHISTSIKSLYRLARVAGIDRAEFERLVQTEMHCLSMMDEDE